MLLNTRVENESHFYRECLSTDVVCIEVIANVRVEDIYCATTYTQGDYLVLHSIITLYFTVSCCYISVITVVMTVNYN